MISLFLLLLSTVLLFNVDLEPRHPFLKEPAYALLRGLFDPKASTPRLGFIFRTYADKHRPRGR